MALGWSPYKLAKEADVTQPTIVRIERGGHVRGPDRSTIEVIERGPLQLGVNKARPLQLGLDEGRPLQLGLDEGRPLQLGVKEARPLQLGLDEGRPPQLGLAEVPFAQVGPGQICLEVIQAGLVLGFHPLLVIRQDALQLLVRNLPKFGFGGGRL
jgi:hypothetical protein